MFIEFSTVIGCDGIRKVCTSAGIDVQSTLPAPDWEGIGVDVRLNDDFSLSQTSLTQFFRTLLPLFKSSGQDVSIRKDGFQSVVVRFFIPGETDDFDELIHK